MSDAVYIVGAEEDECPDEQESNGGDAPSHDAEDKVPG